MVMNLQEQMLHAIQCGTVDYFGAQIAQGFASEMSKSNNWLNTGHSREFWLCEFSGRAMQELALAAHTDESMGQTAIDRGEGDKYGSTGALADLSIEYADVLLKKLESHLKGESHD